MRRIDIPEDELRRLLAEHSFQAIAARYGCDARAVSGLAARYGFASAFKTKIATAEESTRVKALAAQGLKMKEIAGALGRSHTFVARHMREAEPRPRGARGRPPAEEWRAETTAAQALGDRTYDDVDESVLCRECPPHRPVLNGAALAAAARAARLSFSCSTAALCAAEGAEDHRDDNSQRTP